MKLEVWERTVSERILEAQNSRKAYGDKEQIKRKRNHRAQ